MDSNLKFTHFRGYSGKKLEDNIQCEIFQTILEEAQEAYKKEIVHQLSNNELADMETNIDQIVQWVEQFNKSNMHSWTEAQV